MQAAPAWQHQAIIGNIFTQFSVYLQGKSCFAFVSPFDLRLPEGNKKDEEVTTVLQQDKRYGRPEAYTEEDKVKVSIFPDLMIDLAPVFEAI